MTNKLVAADWRDWRQAAGAGAPVGKRGEQGSVDLQKWLGACWVRSRCAGCLRVAARADTAWLRSRYAALTEEELREWRQVWDSVS